MGEVGDKLKAMVVRVYSPDGQIMGRLSTGDAVDIKFKSDEYLASVAPEVLSHQLGRVMTLLVVGRARGRHQILESADFEIYNDKNPHWDKRMRDFYEKRTQVKAAGVSPGQYVAIATIGLRDFKVRFDKDVRRLAASQFATEFRDAVAAMVAAYSERMAQLKPVMTA